MRYQLEGHFEDAGTGEERVCTGRGGSDGVVVGAAGLVGTDAGKVLMGVGTAWHFSFFEADPGSNCPSRPRELIGGSPFEFSTDRKGRAQGTLLNWSQGRDATFDVKFPAAKIRTFQQGADYQAVAGFVGGRAPRLCDTGSPVVDEQAELLYVVLAIRVGSETPEHFIDVEVVEAPEPPWGALVREQYADGTQHVYRIRFGEDGKPTGEEIDLTTGEPVANPVELGLERPERTAVRLFVPRPEPVAFQVDTAHESPDLGNTCDGLDITQEQLARSRLPF